MTQKQLTSEDLEKKYKIKSGVIHMGTIKPLDKNILKRWIPKVDQIITVEENILDGGFGSSILEFINIELPRINTNVYRVGLPNKFIDKYGTQDELHKIYNLDKKYLINVSRKLLYKK